MGCMPKVFQIHPTDVWDSPDFWAMDRHDPCVTPDGMVANMSSMTSAPFSSAMVRGRPGRGSASTPSLRSRTQRRRHRPTVWLCTPNLSALAVFQRPSAQDRTIRYRSAINRARGCFLTAVSRKERSSSANVIKGGLRPRLRRTDLGGLEKPVNTDSKLPQQKNDYFTCLEWLVLITFFPFSLTPLWLSFGGSRDFLALI